MENLAEPSGERLQPMEPEGVLDAPRQGAPEVWGMVPPQNGNFTGREEILDRLHACVTADSFAAVVPHTMHGMGGVGKTQVAIEYAYRYREEYDVVWWIAAEEAHLIEPDIAALAPRLRLASTGSGIEYDATAVLDALRRGIPYRRWLLIFDNAQKPEDVERFLLRGAGHTLITSRNPDWAGLTETVPIDVFTRQESIKFLSRRVPGITSADADALAEALGDLPLVLEQAGALQSKTGMSVSEYLRLFKERASEITAHPQPAGYRVPVTAAWQLSIRQLTDDTPESVELLRCCSFFGPQPIPRDVLPEGHEAVTASLGQILSDPILFARAIGGLNEYSLAKVDVPHRTLQVHPVVQALVRDGLSTQDKERIQHDVHSILAAATPRDPDEASAWPRFRELLPHISPTVVACHDSNVRRCIRDIVRYHYMTGGFMAARYLADQALTLWPTDPGTAATDVLAMRRHLGTVLRAQGDFRGAFKVNAAALAEATEELGPNHVETLRITNSHGADLRAAGDFHGGLVLDENSVQRHIEAFGEADSRTLQAQNNLGLDRALLSDFRTARQLHQHVYLFAKKQYRSETHPLVLAALVNLARDVRMCGEYAEARLITEDTYAACRSNLGESHPLTLRAARDFVVVERLAVGGTEQAVADAEGIMVLQQKLAGKGHPSTVAAATALANAWRVAGNLDKATRLTDETVGYCPQVYGTNHPHTHSTHGNLALLRRLGGDAEAARELHETSVTRLHTLLGPDNHYTLICAMGLASSLAAMDDLAGARNRGQDTADRLHRVLGADHPITLACRINLAADLTALSLDAEADPVRADALERFGRVLGYDHPEVRAAHDGQRLDCDFDPPPS